MFEGGIMACAAWNHEDHASCVALAQNAKGFLASNKLPNASTDGTACSLIAISSLSPSGGAMMRNLDCQARQSCRRFCRANVS